MLLTSWEVKNLSQVRNGSSALLQPDTSFDEKVARGLKYSRTFAEEQGLPLLRAKKQKLCAT